MKKINTISKFSFLFVIALGLSTKLQAQYISNANFESWPAACAVNMAPDGWSNFSVPNGLGPDQGGNCAGVVPSFNDTAHMNLVWSSTGIREGAKHDVELLTPGLTYQVNFYAIHDKGLWADTGSVILNVYHNSNIIFSTPELFYESAWTLYTATFTALSSIDTIGFQVVPGTIGTSGSVGVDAVSISTSESINNLPDQNSVAVFPNPTENLLTVSFHNKNDRCNSISVKNVLNQTIYYQNGINFSETEKIDISHLTAGIYFISFDFNGQLVTKRITRL